MVWKARDHQIPLLMLATLTQFKQHERLTFSSSADIPAASNYRREVAAEDCLLFAPARLMVAPRAASSLAGQPAVAKTDVLELCLRGCKHVVPDQRSFQCLPCARALQSAAPVLITIVLAVSIQQKPCCSARIPSFDSAGRHELLCPTSR
jgi:hypothetical protein